MLDYAESWSKEIVELVRTAVYAKNAPPVRLVLLARAGGDWWNHLADSAGNDKVIFEILQSFQTKAGPYLMEREGIPQENRAELFDEALEDFATFKRKPVPAGDAPNLSDGIFADPLFIHLAAIARLRGEVGISQKDLLGMALGHERSYWRRLLSNAGLSDRFLPAVEQGIALVTLSGGKRSAKEAKAVLARAPAWQQIEGSDRAKVFDLLRRLYALDGGLSGLQPDVLGEDLVSQAFERDDELLDAAFDEKAGHEDSRSALTVLTRLGRRVVAEQRWLRRILERRLSALSEDALYVGMETGSPMPEILAEVVRAAERHERHQAVNLLRVKLPKETANLKTLTVEIRRQAVGFIEDKKTGRGAKRDIALTEALSALALALHDKGQLDEAARAAIEASRHASLAFRSNAEQDRRRLAAVLGNLGNHLRDVCRFEDALKAAEKAEGLWRDLAAKQPEAYTANWATSLVNLSGSLRDVCRFEDALKAAEKAEGLRRELAAKQPEAYTANWATSLVNLSGSLRDVGRFEDALKAAEKAEGLRRDLAAKQPEAYTADWTTSLNNLGNHLGEIGRFEDALKAAEKAEGLRRDLAAKQPEAYTADWTTSLNNLGNHLGEIGRFEDALKAAEKAEGLRRDLAAKQPEAYTADWTTSLNNLGNHLGEIGRFEDALKAAEKAEGLWRDLAAKQPEAYTANWATSLVNLSGSLRDVCRFEDALKAAEKAEGLRRELAAKQPEAYTANWATSLVNLSGSLRDVGRFEDALKAAEKAEGLRRDLAAKQPEAYTADWTTSLNNLGNHLGEIGRFEDALKAAEKAEGLRRDLAAKQPEAYTADWTTSLNNLGNHLGEIGRFEDALKAAEKAEGLRRELAAKQPEAYTANWATSLVNLSGSLRDVCRFEDALKAAEKAEGLRRELAAKQPEAYTANWATSLVNLSGSLRDVCRFEDALKAAEKAEGLRRELAAKQPEAYTANWATSLVNLSGSLRDVGRFEDALKAAEKAEGLRRDLAAKQPEAYTADWTTSLNNLGNHLGEIGRFEDALKAAEKAEGLRRDLAAKQPEAYTADWATSLVNLGNLLGDVGRFEDALKAAEKAEGLRRELAAKQPEAYTANWATSLSNLSEAQVSCGRFGAAVEAAKAAISRISQFAARYPAVYSPWLGYGYRLTAEAYFKLQKIKEAAVEAGTAVQIWSGVATTRKNYEFVQIAKSFLVLMQRERALDQNDAVLSTFSRTLKKRICRAIFFNASATTKKATSGDPRGIEDGGCDFASFLMLQSCSCRCCQNLRDSNEIVGCRSQDEEPLHQTATTVPGLAQAADSLHPAERFFNPFSLDGASAVARMACGAGIDCRTTVGVVLRDMRRAAEFATAGDKIGGVKVLVATYGAATPDIGLDHVERGDTFSAAVGLGQSRINDERIAVLHHQMPHVAELRLLCRRLCGTAGHRGRWSTNAYRSCASRHGSRAPYCARRAGGGRCPRLACGPPSARSSSCWPRLRSACRRRKSARWTAGCGLAAG